MKENLGVHIDTLLDSSRMIFAGFSTDVTELENGCKYDNTFEISASADGTYVPVSLRGTKLWSFGFLLSNHKVRAGGIGWFHYVLSDAICARRKAISGSRAFLLTRR